MDSNESPLHDALLGVVYEAMRLTRAAAEDERQRGNVDLAEALRRLQSGEVDPVLTVEFRPLVAVRCMLIDRRTGECCGQLYDFQQADRPAAN